MKLTKYEHACLDIKEGTDRLVVDPGFLSESLTNLNGITALVITHVHPDHFDQTKVAKIIEANPSLQIFTTQEVKDQLGGQGSVTIPDIGKPFTIGAFNLEFFGGQHATIAPTYPANQNYGVLVNDKLYYPGDSFTPCPKPHQVLAAPAMAPWLRFDDTTSFVPTSSASKFFPTHNGFLNDAGTDLYERMFKGLAEAIKKDYIFLAPGDLLDI